MDMKTIIKEQSKVLEDLLNMALFDPADNVVVTAVEGLKRLHPDRIKRGYCENGRVTVEFQDSHGKSEYGVYQAPEFYLKEKIDHSKLRMVDFGNQSR